MDIKKLFPEKKATRKAFLEFLDKKGFYIVLVLCIAIIGATAVLVTTHNITSSNSGFDGKIIPEDRITASGSDGRQAVQPPANASTGSGIQKSDNKKSEVKTSTSAGTAVAKPSEVPKTTTPPKKEKSLGSTAHNKLAMPVFGTVTLDYAKDKLLYSKTLEEWRTHNGIDIGGDLGTPVKAAGDGIVSEIKSDPCFGITIIIDHQNGIKTVYSNLASDEMVSPNQKVKQGDLIGSIGTTATMEAADQAHLHFEVFRNNTPVNPSDYLPKD